MGNVGTRFWKAVCLSSPPITLAVSQFRVCILWRTRPLLSSKTLTASAVVKYDGRAFGAFPGCVTRCFTPYIMISAAQAHESDDLHHAMSPFSLFLSSFSGAQRILGYVRPRRTVAVHPPKRRKGRSICGLHLEEPSNWDSLRAVLWHNWPSNAAFEGCRPWTETQPLLDTLCTDSKYIIRPELYFD